RMRRRGRYLRVAHPRGQYRRERAGPVGGVGQSAQGRRHQCGADRRNADRARATGPARRLRPSPREKAAPATGRPSAHASIDEDYLLSVLESVVSPPVAGSLVSEAEPGMALNSDWLSVLLLSVSAAANCSGVTVFMTASNSVI